MRLLRRLHAWLREPVNDPEVVKKEKQGADKLPATLGALKRAGKWPLQG
jgi:hypothetical protein